MNLDILALAAAMAIPSSPIKKPSFFHSTTTQSEKAILIVQQDGEKSGVGNDFLAESERNEISETSEKNERREMSETKNEQNERNERNERNEMSETSEMSKMNEMSETEMSKKSETSIRSETSETRERSKTSEMSQTNETDETSQINKMNETSKTIINGRPINRDAFCTMPSSPPNNLPVQDFTLFQFASLDDADSTLFQSASLDDADSTSTNSKNMVAGSSNDIRLVMPLEDGVEPFLALVDDDDASAISPPIPPLTSPKILTPSGPTEKKAKKKRKYGLKPKDDAPQKLPKQWPESLLQECLPSGAKAVRDLCPLGKKFVCVACADAANLTKGVLNMRRPFNLHRWNEHKNMSSSHENAIKNLEAEEADRRKKERSGVEIGMKRKAQSQMACFFLVVKKRRDNLLQSSNDDIVEIDMRPTTHVPLPPAFQI